VVFTSVVTVVAASTLCVQCGPIKSERLLVSLKIDCAKTCANNACFASFEYDAPNSAQVGLYKIMLHRLLLDILSVTVHNYSTYDDKLRY